MREKDRYKRIIEILIDGVVGDPTKFMAHMDADGTERPMQGVRAANWKAAMELYRQPVRRRKPKIEIPPSLPLPLDNGQ